MKKIKIFKSGFGEKLKLLLIPIGLLIGSLTTQVWAERWVSKCNINYYTHNGYEQTHDGWHNNDGIDISTNNVTINFGNLTQFYLKESWAKGSFDASWGTAGCKMIYGFSADNQTDYALDWGDQTGDNPKHYGFPISQYDVISHAPNNPGQNTLYVYYHLNYNRGDGGDRKSKTLYINFTIPGFSGAPASKSFGTSIPVNTESETTISFTHYGNALEVGDCSLSNATDFEIRSISESGVNVIFKPITTGAKSSTLTITDDHGKTCTITLSGTAVAKGTTTRLYFNNFINKDGIKSNSNWTADGALSRFTVQYTTGVYTHYPMTQCVNSTYNYYADVEIKESTVSVDRYNPSTPYNTWNTANISGINTTNRYAQLDNYDGNFYGFATNHPYNDVSGGNIYYDNSKSGLTNTIYLVVGHDYKMTDGGEDAEYSKGYALGNIPNTKLYYGTFADTWHDADYYAFIGASLAPSDGEWGSNDLSSKASSSSYTGIFRDVMDLKSGSTYLGFAPSKTGGALSMTKSPTLNTTQTFNYALSTDGGSTYPALTSGPNTPGELSMSFYEFTNAGCTAVVAKSAQELAANATIYTKAVSNVAYTGTTVLTESNTREGYTFMGWYKGNSTIRTNSSTHSFTYYPQGDSTYTARYKAHRYTINFSANDAQYSSAPVATGSTTGISNVVYDQNVTLTANGFSREGYTFAGWSTTPTGDVAYTNSQSVSNLTATDGATVTLYAQWNEILHDITVEYKYGETSVQVDGKVEDVGIVTTKDATAPATIGGYSFTEWSTLPSAVKTSDELTENTITINATDDGQTITANYEPTTYNGTLEGVDGSDGTYSVVYGETSLTVTGDAPARTGYHPYAYYLSYNESTKDYSNPIADKSETSSKELFESVSVSSTDYTNSDKQWIYTGSAPTIYVKWEKNTYTVTLDAQLGTGTSTRGTESFTATTDEAIPAVTMPTQVGYRFDGYFTDNDTQIFGTNGAIIGGVDGYTNSNGTWAHDGNVTLYAHWTPVALSFVGGEGESGKVWGTAANWSPACVPTSSHNVTINAETKITGSAVADTVTIAEDGKVIIEATGVLEVGSTVINTNSDKLVINTTTSSQGALIFDITKTSPSATVNMKLNGSGFHLIASPTGGAKVSSTFAGSGIYTYAWEEGKGWDHRGYYDDFTGNEAILIYGQTSCTFSGILSKACGGSLRYTAEPADANAQGINMLANPLTAPIKIKELSFSGSADGCVHILENGSWRSYAPASSQAADAVIPALQGYGVIAESSGSVSFNYTNAVRNASSHNDALRAPKRATEDTPDYMTISVLTGERKIDLQLSEHAQFSERIDKGWEAIYIEGDGRFGELYAVADKKMNILATPDLEGTVLGFVPGQAASYTISFEGDGRGYYLNDVETKKSTLIEEGNTYTFSRSDNDAARFIISRTPIQNLPTGVGDVNDGAQARKVIIDNKIYIIRGGRMYDTTGALVK